MMMMMMRMMRASLTSLLVILSIFCSSTCAFHRQQLSCREGEVPCTGASQRCIPEEWLCDGIDNCFDNSDEDYEMCQNHECSSGYLRCPGESSSHLCVKEVWLCDGHDQCRDDSDEDPQFCQTSELYRVRTCVNPMQRCFLALAAQFAFASEEAIVQHIANTDLRATCGPLLIAKECATSVLNSLKCHLFQTGHGRIIDELKRQIAIAMTTMDHVCRENVEVYDEHKACLLRLGNREPAILETAKQRCAHFLQSTELAYCIPQEAVDCVSNVVSEQCGQEIAGKVRELGSQLVEMVSCNERKHSKVMTKKMHSPLEMLQEAISSLF